MYFMKKSRKEKGLILFTLFTLLLVVIGATYAYFVAQKGTGGSANLTVQADTTDNLSFSAKDGITINATSDNFKSDGANLDGETTATATLIANNTTHLATEHYNVYLVIDTNDLTYTNESNPELLLTVYDENDNEVKDGIDGLEYKENIQGVSGFDITDKQNSFTLSANNEIKVEEKDVGQKEETWKIKVTLINYEYDQQVNTGKTFHAGLVITKDNLESYRITKVTGATVKRLSNSLTATLEVEEGNQQVEGYYFAKEEIGAVATVANVDDYTSHEYIKSETNTYTFNDLKENTNYKIYSYAQDINGFKSPVYVTDLVATEKIYTFTYTGSEQEFVPPQDGIYKIELWGAQGGDFGGYFGGKGAYTVGKIDLATEDKFYVYVGQSGFSELKDTYSFNGGASMHWNMFGATGGGATDVRLINGEWKLFDSLKSRIMVAAGGGGANNRNNGEMEYYGAGNGGAGGTLNGLPGEVDISKTKNPDGYTWGYVIGLGGSQDSGGSYTLAGNDDGSNVKNDLTIYGLPNGGFGYGSPMMSGGGGGYYSGGSGEHAGAGGGSSYISGFDGCKAIKVTSTEEAIEHEETSVHYSGKKFTDANMIAGNAPMPTHDGKNTMTGNSGDGYAKITLVG